MDDAIDLQGGDAIVTDLRCLLMEEGVDAIDLLIGGDAIESRAIHLYYFRVGNGDGLFIVTVVRFIDFVDLVFIVIVGIGSFLRVGDAIDSRVIQRRHYHLFRLGDASASLSE